MLGVASRYIIVITKVPAFDLQGKSLAFSSDVARRYAEQRQGTKKIRLNFCKKKVEMFVRMSVIDYFYARRRMSLSLSLSLNLNILTAKTLTLKNTKEVIFLLENRINPTFL